MLDNVELAAEAVAALNAVLEPALRTHDDKAAMHYLSFEGLKTICGKSSVCYTIWINDVTCIDCLTYLGREIPK